MSQLVIDSRKTALVAIDLQNAVLQMNPAPHAAAEVVSNNRRISNVLRAKGGLVVWVRVDINQAIRLPVDVPMPFEGTLPFLYLSAKHFSLGILAVTLFVRGMGMSTVGIPSISAAYASVRKEELPMATTSLNIVQRLGGPTLTTVCATFLGWRLGVVHSAGISSAFTMSFALLCGFHSVLILAARRLPLSLESVGRP